MKKEENLRRCISASKRIASDIYTILVNLGGAAEHDRPYFVKDLLNTDMEEWRFVGKFGFGGKYRKKSNSVDYYIEDETIELNALQKEINKALSDISDEWMSF